MAIKFGSVVRLHPYLLTGMADARALLEPFGVALGGQIKRPGTLPLVEVHMRWNQKTAKLLAHLLTETGEVDIEAALRVRPRLEPKDPAPVRKQG